MPPWYKTIVGGSSKKLKGSKSRESMDDTSSAADDSGLNASTSTATSTTRGVDSTASSSQPVSIPPNPLSSSRSRQSTAASDDVPMPDGVLGTSPSHAARRTNGVNDAAGVSPGKSSTATSRSPQSTSSHAAGKQSISSTMDGPATTADAPTTTTILSNPLPAHNPVGGSSFTGGSGSSSVPTSSSSSALRTFDVDDMIARLLDAGYSAKITKSVALKNAEITAVCQAAREIFLAQPTLLELSPPVKIVGDVHGQYSDLIRLFEMCGFPPSANYLFLGDYVDRGKQSLETILLLLCYKIKYPENFFLLRGNHECANVTRVYGFYDECKRRCNIKVWKTFIDVFNCLPIAGVVASKIFCVHGGLSPSLSNMDDIRRLQRPSDVPDYGLLNDLLWSDPSDTALDWEDNERGVSYCFGKTVIQDFLSRYDFDLICRAHMVVEDGYEFWNERTLVTIFSAPNYCGEFDNHGAVMSVSEDLLCSFELLKPLDNAALKKEMARGRRRASAAAQEAAAAAANGAPLTTVTSATPNAP